MWGTVQWNCSVGGTTQQIRNGYQVDQSCHSLCRLRHNVMEYHKKIMVSIFRSLITPEEIPDLLLCTCFPDVSWTRRVHKRSDCVCIAFSEASVLCNDFFQYKYMQSQSQSPDTPWNGNTMFRSSDRLRVSSETEMWSLQQIDHSATNTWKHYECDCTSLQGHPCVFIHICAPQTPFVGDGSGASGLFWKVRSEQQSQKNDVFSHFVHYALFIIQSQWFPLKKK